MANVVDIKDGYRVRLREDHPLPVSVDIEGKKTIRVTLPPNQWVTVPKPIFDALQKFRVDRVRDVPDYEANDRAPHKAGQPAIMRTESKPGHVIEGLGDD